MDSYVPYFPIQSIPASYSYSMVPGGLDVMS